MDASPQLQQLMDNTDPCEIVFDWFKNLKNSSFINDGKNKIETSENETICSPTMEFLDQLYQPETEDNQDKDECSSLITKSLDSLSSNETFCTGGFDGFLCWPHGDPGTIVRSPCNEFVVGTSNESNYAYRYCLSDGSWFKNENSTWNNNKDCKFFTNETLEEMDGYIIIDAEGNFATALNIATAIGYSLSISCIVLAITLLLSLRKLRCLTNLIHVHLMLSFLFFCCFQILHEKQSNQETLTHCSDLKLVGWCRTLTSLHYYSIIANFSWLLAEGIHLQVLLHFPLKVKNYFNRFSTYFVISWGAPWIVICISIADLLRKKTPGCWIENSWWISKWFIYFMITVNLIIFINVFRIIYYKSRNENLPKKESRGKLAKPLFALFVLLGTHHAMLEVLADVIADVAKGVWWFKWMMFMETVITSFQGAAVAMFFCFLNTEVHKTVKRVWNDWNTKRRLPNHSNNNSCKPANSNNGREHYIDSPDLEKSEKKFHYFNETSHLLISGEISPILSSATIKI